MYRGQHQNPESAPLLANNAVNNAAQERDDNNGCAKRCSLFSFFCFLSGQYINIDTTGERPSRCNIISIAGFIIFLGQFVLHYGHLVIATIVEVFRIGNMSYTVAGDDYDVQCILPQEYWKFYSAITVGALAAWISYTLFGIILLPLDSALCRCNCERSTSKHGLVCNAHRKAFQNNGLSPFDNSTILSCTERVDFYCTYCFFHYFIVFGFIAVVLFFLFLYNVQYNDFWDQPHFLYNLDLCWIHKLNFIRCCLYLNTLFCGVQSCFVFSKIIVKVNFKLNRLAVDLDQVDFAVLNQNVQIPIDLRALVQSNDREKVDRARYIWLQKMYQDFSQLVSPTVLLLGLWLIFHWVSFMITTVLLSASLKENIIDVYTGHRSVLDVDVDFQSYLIPTLICFILVHLFLVLYPLCRAASIATTRANLITVVSKKRWVNVPLSVQSNFLQYLITENFSFKSIVFNTLVTVDIKWVYLTILLVLISAALI